MKMDSPHWNVALGLCTKHMLPSIPCPACLADGGDPDLFFTPTSSDYLAIQMADEPITLRDLVPANIKNPVIL